MRRVSLEKVLLSIRKLLSALFFYSTYLLATIINISLIVYLVSDGKTAKDTFWGNVITITVLLIYFFYGVYFLLEKKLRPFFKNKSGRWWLRVPPILDLYVLLSFFGYLFFIINQHFVVSPWMQDMASTLEYGTYTTSVLVLSAIAITTVYIFLFTYIITHVKHKTLQFASILLILSFSTFFETMSSVLLERYAILQTIFGVSVLYLYFNYVRHRYLQYTHPEKQSMLGKGN